MLLYTRVLRILSQQIISTDNLNKMLLYARVLRNTYKTTLRVIRRFRGGGSGRGWRGWDPTVLQIICCDQLLRLSVVISCWDYLLRLYVEIICCDQLLRLSVEINCLDYLLRLSVEIICYGQLLRLSVVMSCWDYLLRLSVEIICWDHLLRLSVVIISLKPLCIVAFP